MEEQEAAPAGPDRMEIVAELRKLPANQRTALVLHYLLDLPVEQVAEQLQAPVGTVKVWLYRGRQSLAAQLTTQTQAVPGKPTTDEIIQRARRRHNRKITIVGVLVLLVLVAVTVSARFFRGPAPVISPSPTRSALCTYQSTVVVVDSGTIAKGKLVKDEEALLVVASPGYPYVLWRGRLFETRQPIADRLAPGVMAVPAAQAFLDELPKGQPIEQIAVEGVGGKSNLNPLWTVGEVITIFGVSAEDRYVLVGQDNLSYVTQLQAQVAAFNGRRMGIEELTDNGRVTVRNGLLPREADQAGQPPADLPNFVATTDSSVCSIGADGDTQRQTVVNVPLP